MRNDIASHYTRTLGLTPIVTVPSTVVSASVDATLAEASCLHFEVIVGAMVANSTIDLKLQYALAATPTTWVDEPAYGASLPVGLAYNTKTVPQILAATGADQLYSLVVNAPVGKHYRVSATIGTANATVGVMSIFRAKNVELP